ncbi:MAG: InlB B-repeat-containing protein [Peptococcaceae bacterium]|nr:InlB B-repeat-containing protein [Peptococcaceae bacterium]
MKPKPRWLTFLSSFALVLFLSLYGSVADVHGADPQEKTVTVKFISYNGIEQVINSEVTRTITVGETMMILVPELSDYPGGWVPRGWVDSPEATSEGINPEQIQTIWTSDDMIFYGVYERQVKLIFETGSEDVQAPENASCQQFVNSSDVTRTYGGQTFRLPSEVIKTNANFGGWVVNDSNGAKYPPESWAIIGLHGADSATMQAVWEPIIYTIHYNRNGSTMQTPPDQKKAAGEPIILAEMTRDNMVFKGWARTSGNPIPQYPVDTLFNDDNQFDADGNLTLYAVWHYGISYDANVDEGDLVKDFPDDFTVEFTNNPTTLSAQKPERQGYTFLGWARSENATVADYHEGHNFEPLRETLYLYAVWERDALLSPPTVYSQEELPSDFDVYLCIGQSNMAGYGASPEDQDLFAIPNALLFNGEQWQTAQFDNENTNLGLNRYNNVGNPLAENGLNPAFYFADTMQVHSPGKTIGIISDARGGSSISQWARGGDAGREYFRSACEMTHKALEQGGTLRGILWLQGEADLTLNVNGNNLALYMERLNSLVDNLRDELGVSAEQCPFIAGEIPYTYTSNNMYSTYDFNSILWSFTNPERNTDYVSAAGELAYRQTPEDPAAGGLLSQQGDPTHFSTSSQREMGKRFAEKMLDMQSKTYTVTYDYWENGGNTVSQPMVTAPIGTEIDLTISRATREGWAFVGWHWDPDAEEKMDSFTMPGRDVTLYAIYKKELKASLVYYEGAEKVTEEVIREIFNKDTSGSLPFPIPNCDGWTFRGWTTKDIPNASATGIISSMIITANMPTQTYYGLYVRGLTVSFNADGGVPVPINQTGRPQYFNSFDIENKTCPTVTLAGPVSKQGFDFEGWVNDVTGELFDANTVIYPADHESYAARWKSAQSDWILVISDDFSGNVLNSENWGSQSPGSTKFGVENDRLFMGDGRFVWLNDQNALTDYAVEFAVTKENQYFPNSYLTLQFSNSELLILHKLWFKPTGYGIVSSSAPALPLSYKGTDVGETVYIRVEVVDGQITVFTKDSPGEQYQQQGISYAVDGLADVPTFVGFVSQAVDLSIGSFRLYKPYQEPADKETDVALGMYYFGGWSVNSSPSLRDPWTKDNSTIMEYYNGEREPLRGWYDLKDNVELVNEQLEWMSQYGIDFISFAWYWSADNVKFANAPWENWEPDHPALSPETAIRAYWQTENSSRIPYTLLWCNEGSSPSPRTPGEWDEMVEYWIDRHLSNSKYYKIDGKPAVFIISPKPWMAGVIGMTPADMLQYARDKAIEKGLEGIYFVVCTDMSRVNDAMQLAPDALTGYSYRAPDWTGYSDLDGNSQRPGYRGQWNKIMTDSTIPFFVPMSAGRDETPWGGSNLPCMPTPDEFETHLRAGYDVITGNMEKTKGIGMLYAWDEYGEGGFIEPTRVRGFKFLERIHRIFRERE